MKIRFQTKKVGHGEFRSGLFEFLTAPEYGTIYPSWHLDPTTSFPTAQAQWTRTFHLQILARKSLDNTTSIRHSGTDNRGTNSDADTNNSMDNNSNNSNNNHPAADGGQKGSGAAKAKANANANADPNGSEVQKHDDALAWYEKTADQSIVQVNPHTEEKDEEFVADSQHSVSLIPPEETVVDMSGLIFLPNQKSVVCR